MQNLLWVSLFFAGLAGLSHGQRISLPGGLFYDVELSDVPCLEVVNEFKEEFVDLDRDSACSQFGARQWSKFRGGYVGTFFPAIRTTTSLDECLQLAGPIEGAQKKLDAATMCHHVERLKDTCVCDKLFCVTDVINREIEPEELYRCRGFSQKMCVNLSGLVSSACRAVIDNPPEGPGIQFDLSVVPHECDQSQCRSASSSASRGLDLAATAAVGPLAFAVL